MKNIIFDRLRDLNFGLMLIGSIQLIIGETGLGCGLIVASICCAVPILWSDRQ